MVELRLHNGQSVAIASVPVCGTYEEFTEEIRLSLQDQMTCHVVNYFGVREGAELKLYIFIADDSKGDIKAFACLLEGAVLKHCGVLALERYEREIAENFGLTLEDHPWPKPVRTAPDDYPFYTDDSIETHQVGVGPIHAGVIEPGHFRFTCTGEKILHLEIMLGYQHRGIEKLMLGATDAQRRLLVEGIAGDSVIEHSSAYAMALESLSGSQVPARLQLERCLAAELERVAIHTGDLGALCGDLAYQLGASVYGRLRTPIINFMQKWCGNRLGKTLVRPFEQVYPFTPDLAYQLQTTLDAFERDFVEISERVRTLPGIVSRFEHTGICALDACREIGAVGMPAKAAALERDIRRSHPYYWYKGMSHELIIKHHGDIFSRTQMRMLEVRQSLGYIREIVKALASLNEPQVVEQFSAAGAPASAGAGVGAGVGAGAVAGGLAPLSICVALTEGWRGEVCHVALTDAAGQFSHYKICDPSFHNWKCLELAVRNNGISDFPISNKSFNLSYTGHDL